MTLTHAHAHTHRLIQDKKLHLFSISLWENQKTKQTRISHNSTSCSFIRGIDLLSNNWEGIFPSTIAAKDGDKGREPIMLCLF